MTTPTFRRVRSIAGTPVTLYATDPRGPWASDVVHLSHYAERIARACRGEADWSPQGGVLAPGQQAERAKRGRQRRGMGRRWAP
jgi:hypothetical protein